MPLYASDQSSSDQDTKDTKLSESRNFLPHTYAVGLRDAEVKGALINGVG